MRVYYYVLRSDDLIAFKCLQYFNALLGCVQYLSSIWFLDGKTSVLVSLNCAGSSQLKSSTIKMRNKCIGCLSHAAKQWPVLLC